MLFDFDSKTHNTIDNSYNYHKCVVLSRDGNVLAMAALESSSDTIIITGSLKIERFDSSTETHVWNTIQSIPFKYSLNGLHNTWHQSNSNQYTRPTQPASQ